MNAMYMERRKMMGDLTKRRNGRRRPWRRTSGKEAFFFWSTSYALHRSVRPSSLAKRAVFHRRSTGAHVSRLRHSTPKAKTPPAINKIQNTHRQPISSPINPPHIGPITGPMSGPTPQIEVAMPRFSTGKRSAMTPAPRVMLPTPPTPARKRNTIKDSMLGARAQASCHMTKNQLAPLRTMRRPYISLRGASNDGPNYEAS